MKLLLPLWGIIIFLMPSLVLTAQDTEEIQMIPYSPGFKFKDGIFFNIEMLKANRPLPPTRIVSDQERYDKVFFDEITASDKILFYDNNGIKTSITTKDVWGFAHNGRLYIMVGSMFHRIIIEGNISLFIASATTHVKTKFSQNDTSMPNITTEDLHRVNKYYMALVTSERKEYLFDFESNKLMGYHIEALGELLERDSVLFFEYASLRKREKKKMMVDFIRRYNENHPLYFPDN